MKILIEGNEYTQPNVEIKECNEYFLIMAIKYLTEELITIKKTEAYKKKNMEGANYYG